MATTTSSQKDSTCPEALRRCDYKRSVFANFIAKIPQRYTTGLGKILGFFLYHFALSHRRIVLRNLQFVYPEWSRNQIYNLTKRICQHFGITILEFLQMAYLSNEELMRSVKIEGLEILAKALSNQRGVVLISAHIGNWEIAWQACPGYLQRQITGVAKKLRNKRLNRMIHNRRTHFGNRILYKKGALPDLMQTLRRGGMVGLLLDISRRFDGVEVKFFGHRATATPAAALLAIRCKSPIIPAFSHRNAEGQLTIQIEPPIEIQRTNDLRADLQINTQLITDRVERAIRNYPDQWNWSLKRWKEFYPALYPDTAERMRKIKKKELRKRKVKKSSS
jgi:KDO2-lipid IV(A) lauroyltransferase